MAFKTVRTICFECHSRCGVLLDVMDGKLVKVRGDLEHPFSRGFVCPKARAVPEIIYHKDRIIKPLKRSGYRNQCQWDEITWGQAMNEIAAHLNKIKERFGAESVVLGQGTTRGLPPYLNRFLALFGSPNLMGTQNLSGFPLIAGSIHTCGFSLMGTADYAHAKCIVLWGHNPHQAWPGLYLHDLKAGLHSGAKLIVIDPRLNKQVSRADLWLGLRPGTDAALALGMINLLISRGLYDKEFIENWTVGFEQLKAHVAEFTLERTSEITWVSPGKIEDAANTLGTLKPACIGAGMAGVCQNINSFQTCRALTILCALTGNLEIKGGNIHYSSPLKERTCYGSYYDACNNLPLEQTSKRLGRKEFPAINYTFTPAESVWKAILNEDPYPVKALILFANNSIVAFAESPKVKKALEKVELLVSVDYFFTPTAQLADYVLPPAHWTERDDIEDLLMKGHVFCQPKALEPVGESRDEKEILIDLAHRLDLKGYWTSVEESLDDRLKNLGMTYAQFKLLEPNYVSSTIRYKRYEKRGRFLTPTGKLELYSKGLGQLGLPPMPIYIEPPESPLQTPKLQTQFPLVLTTGGRHIAFYHSALRNIEQLRRRAPEPLIEIHPQTAIENNVGDGDWVWVVTHRGRIQARVRFFQNIHPAVVHVYHGYWYGLDDGWRLWNINMITDSEHSDQAVGSIQLRGLLCRIEKANRDSIVKG